MTVLVMLAALFASPIYAENLSCSDVHVVIPLDARQASAGFFANLRGSEQSIRIQSDRILEESTERFEQSTPPALACPRGCRLPKEPQIVFHAVPNKYLSDYEDQGKCQAYFKQTLNTPLAWLDARFDDYEEFSERFSDFSQGEGKYGEELYERCDGSCSPQYTIAITPHLHKAYTANVYVVCGHARDKDDAMYTLSTSLLWECVPVV